MFIKRFVLLISILLYGLAFSQTIDVLIKGMDDGVKTNKQQDYAEASMNAKLQAIERAGVEIKSITEVENFQLKYDMVESKAEAVLLPGFQIMDIGYQTDGTYQIVLSGKIKTDSESQQKGDIKAASLKEDLNGPWELILSKEKEKQFIIIEHNDPSIKFWIQNKAFEGKFNEGSVDISGGIGNIHYIFKGAISTDGQKIMGMYQKSNIMFPGQFVDGSFQMIRQ
jgi:hypothetical protein